MAAADPVFFWLVVGVMVIGVLGSAIPGVPGGWMIFLAALVYAFLTEFSVIGWVPVVIIGAIALIATVADVFVTGYGARRFGASRAGTVGGIVGGVVGGLVGSTVFGVGAIIGLPLGAVAGIYLAERWRRRALDHGEHTSVGRSVRGVTAGYLVSALVEMILGVIATGIFIIMAMP